MRKSNDFDLIITDDMAWTKFVKTGSVADYLLYKKLTDKK